jgi:4-amino-4-deoxy-L-arabinose transferase-like glycosyltransferase
MLAAYAVARIALLASDMDVTRAVSHDSGYIGIVARNLLEGRGYVNDAHWLLFLSPPALPMSFHNANPLYPTLTAIVMALTGSGPITAAAVLSILGSVLSAIGVFFLVRHFGVTERLAIACAAVPLFLPPLFRISFAALPDALALGLVLCLLAVVVRARDWSHWLIAGALFGLAWLTRSTAVLVLPAIGIWVLARKGMRATWRAGLVAAAGTLVMIAPWLVRNAIVRGGPFESDSSFYLLIDYYAERSGRSVDQLYRSIVPPPPIGDDVDGVIRTTAEETPDAVVSLASAFSQSDRLAAIVLMAALLSGAWILRRRRWRIDLFAAALLFVVTVGVFTVRGAQLEPRYLATAFTLLGLLLLAPFGVPLAGRMQWLRVPALVYLVAFLIPQNLRIARTMRATDPVLAEFRAAAESLDAAIPDSSAAVISHLPYLFTLYTGRQSVSPPYPGKTELLGIMERYHASHVFLPADDFPYYYRGGPGSLGPELSTARPVSSYLVLQRRPGIHDLARRPGVQRTGWNRRAISTGEYVGPRVGR